MAGAPVIYEHSAEAGPDETFFVVGDNLTTNLVAWGVSDKDATGQSWPLRVQFGTPHYLAATLPEKAHDGPFVVWVKNAAGCSAPIVLNAPQPWWCFPRRCHYRSIEGCPNLSEQTLPRLWCPPCLQRRRC